MLATPPRPRLHQTTYDQPKHWRPSSLSQSYPRTNGSPSTGNFLALQYLQLFTTTYYHRLVAARDNLHLYFDRTYTLRKAKPPTILLMTLSRQTYILSVHRPAADRGITNYYRTIYSIHLQSTVIILTALLTTFFPTHAELLTIN